MFRRWNAHNHRLYLLATQKKHDYIEFSVMGTSGNVYEILLYPYGAIKKCTCPDHVHRKKFCKHMFFVQDRVLNEVEAPKRWNVALKRIEDSERTANFYAPGNLISAYNKIVNSDHEQTEVKQREFIDQECVICLEIMTKEDQLVWCKRVCGNSVHRSCYENWRKHNKSTCVHCRNDWIDNNNKNETQERYINLESYV